MKPMTCQWRSAAARGEGSDDSNGGAATDRAGRRAMSGRPLPGDDRCCNDYKDYANRGAGKDDAPLEEDGYVNKSV